MKSRLFNLVLTMALAAGLATPLAMAQDEQTQPTSGVARVSLINGDVSTQRGDSGDWVATTINAPLVLGDRISTGNGSRTEVQLDYADVIRLDQNTEAKIADLTRSRIQVQLAQGLMDFSVFKGGQADVEIDTPNVAVVPAGPGAYRIEVDNQGETQVIVRDGQAQISTPQGSTTVKAGDLITVEGTDNPQYRVTQAPALDAWDNWNRDRDNVILNAQSYTHTNRYYTGSQDLDRYGHWVDVPGYDWCWTPYVDAGWVPYRDGRWVWEPGWGWTWVSYESWGWAPYHYGRWFYYGSSWLWWPGYVGPAYYPVWAPAYVSFIGFGWGHYGYGYGFGSIGWLPLGPRDRFHPWYGRGRSYNVVNVTNITNITNVNNIHNGQYGSNFHNALTNARVRGALTTVSTSDFTNGRMPTRRQSVSEAQLRQGNVIQGTLPVVPTRQSLSPVNRPAVVPAVAHNGAGQRAFFTRNKPPAVNQSFARNTAQIQQMVKERNTPGAANPGTTGAGRTPQAGRVSAAGSGAASANTRTRPGAAAQTQTTTRTAPARTNSGWRSFGEKAAPGSTGPTAGARASEAAGRPAAGRTQSARPAPAAQQKTGAGSSGWSRFGSSAAPAASQTRATGSRAPRESQPEARPQAAPATNRSGAASPGFKKFNGPESRPAPSATKSAPRSSQPATKSAPRSAPATRNDSPSRSSSNWRSFTPQPGPGSRSASSQAEPARSGWSGFQPNGAAPRSERMNTAPRSESPAYRQAPRTYQRSPLGIRKPIVVERSPRSYGSSNQGSWGRVSRGSSAGRSGGWSAPRSSSHGGGGRSVARSSSRGGGGRRH
jgi:Family of unknown function (DUF6600)/FecR protein